MKFKSEIIFLILLALGVLVVVALVLAIGNKQDIDGDDSDDDDDVGNDDVGNDDVDNEGGTKVQTVYVREPLYPSYYPQSLYYGARPRYWRYPGRRRGRERRHRRRRIWA